MALEQLTSETKTSETKNKFIDFCLLNSKKIIITLMIVVGAALSALGGVWSVYSEYYILAVVGNQKIIRSDLNKSLYSLDSSVNVNNPSNAKDTELTKKIMSQLVDESIIRQEAEKKGIRLDDNQVMANVRAKFPDYDTRIDLQKEIIKKNAEDEMLEQKVKEKVLSYSNGKYLLYRFDTYLSGDKKDLAKYDSDKEYAFNLANNTYQKLKDGEINYDQAKETLEKDPRIGTPIQEKENILGILDGELNKDAYELGLGPVGSDEFKKQVAAVKPGEVGKPSILQVAAYDKDPKQATNKDGIYAVIIVDSRVDGEAVTWDDWLKTKREEYGKKKHSLLTDLLYPGKAYAIGSCDGGLVTTGTGNPAGFWVKFWYYDEFGNRYDNSGSKVTFNTTSTSSYSWGGNTKYCSSASIVRTNVSPDTFHDGADFWGDGTGWVKLGYAGCGANGYGMLCSCASNYTADLSYNNSNDDSGGGYWSSIRYYFTNGSNSVYAPAQSNPEFAFSAIGNGNTAGFYANYQENHSPYPYHLTPADGTSVNIASGSSTYPMNFTGKATDSDGDAVDLRMAYKKTTDASWTYVPSGGYTGLIDQNTKGDFGTFNLGPGTYQWRIWSRDAHSKTNAAAANGNIAELVGDWYFTINAPSVTLTPTACTNGTITPGTAMSLTYGNNSTTFTATAPTGYTFDGFSIDNGANQAVSSYTFTNITSNHTIRANCTINSYTLTYNANGGTGAPGAQNANYNQSLTVSSTVPTYSGYTFNGWNTASNGSGTNYSAGNSITMTSNVTLYAKWTNNTPVTTLTSPANGSSYQESVANTGLVITGNVVDNGDNVDLMLQYALKTGGVYGSWTNICPYTGSWHASGAAGYTRSCNTKTDGSITFTAGNTYGLKATGKDDAGLTSSSAIRDFSVTVNPNAAPTITLVSPTYPPTRNFDTGTAVPLVARGEDPDGDTVNITISYQPSGGSWTTLCAYDVGYHAEPWTRTCNMPTTAPAGTYAWHARVTDGSVSVLSVDWYFNLVNPSTPQFSCTVGPDTGNRPLVVRAQITKVNDGSGSVAWASYAPTDPFGINFWVGHAGFEVYQTTADFVNSYANAGTYDVQYKVKYVNQAGTTVDGPWVVCNPTRVTVSDPNSSGGGEVAP